MRRMRRGSGAFEAPGSPIEEDEMSRKRSPTGCREGCAAPSLRGTNQGLPGARFLRQGPTLLDHDEIVHLHDLRPVANAQASPELRVQQAKERNERPALARAGAKDSGGKCAASGLAAVHGLACEPLRPSQGVAEGHLVPRATASHSATAIAWPHGQNLLRSKVPTLTRRCAVLARRLIAKS